jgi:hypothetical protein
MTPPSGAYRRRILITSSANEATAELEDDFHHFRVVVGHDGTHVTGVRGESLRFPWSTCPAAASQLQPLTGMVLRARSTAVGDVIAARDNCTHMFDLAGLAVAQAARGTHLPRQYDVLVPDPVDGRRRVGVSRDGVTRLTWLVDRDTILDPEPFAGRALRGSFLAWAESALDDDTAEAAIVLRRACHIAFGRLQDLDVYADAGPLLPIMSGACFTFQPERAPTARRMLGTARDFTATPERLLRAAQP